MRHRFCSECRKSLAKACERRIARGLPCIPANGKTCSHACAVARQDRWQRERWLKFKPRQVPPRVPGPWRCVECGNSRRAADRKRKRLGLPPTDRRHVVCSPECAEARRRSRYLWRFGYAPRLKRAATGRAT